MKKIITLIMFTFIVSCSSSAPGDAAKSFFENMAHGKIDEAKKYATEPTGKMLDFAAQLGGTPIEPDFKVEIIKDSIVGKKAWVTLKTYKGDEKNEKQETVELVEIDGKWLVHMDSKK